MEIYLPGTGTLVCAVWPGAGIAHSQGILPHFYPPHVNVGLPIPPATATSPPPKHCPLCPSSPSPPLLPIWMNMASLNPWRWTSRQFDFLAVLDVFCFEVSCDLSYGCARRRSMSTYSSILTRNQKALENHFLLKYLFLVLFYFILLRYSWCITLVLHLILLDSFGLISHFFH